MIPLYLVAFSISSACFTQMPFYLASILFVTFCNRFSLLSRFLLRASPSSFSALWVKPLLRVTQGSNYLLVPSFCLFFVVFSLPLSWFCQFDFINHHGQAFACRQSVPPWHLTGKEGFVSSFTFPQEIFPTTNPTVFSSFLHQYSSSMNFTFLQPDVGSICSLQFARIHWTLTISGDLDWGWQLSTNSDNSP